MKADGATILPLEVSDLGFSADGRILLAQVSLRFEAGTRTVILGPNGAGKSLLLRLCHGLIRPTTGRLAWRGLRAADPGAVRRAQAMVFQRPVLLRRSVLANITFVLGIQGKPWAARKPQAMAALELFGLEPLADRSAQVLSGGEQQRLALARAWAMAPEVLFLDEPTAALDPASTLAVEEAIRRFHEAGTKIVMTTHDLGQARRLADEVMFLSGGRLVEHASAERFFTAPSSAAARAYLAGELAC